MTATAIASADETPEELEARVAAMNPDWSSLPAEHRAAVLGVLRDAPPPDPEGARRLARMLRHTPMWQAIAG